MRNVSRWIVGIGVLALVISLYYNRHQAIANQGFRAAANADLTLGLGSIYFAGESLSTGNKAVFVSAYEGIGRLQSAAVSLPNVNGIPGLVRYFEDALTAISEDGETHTGEIDHYDRVMLSIKKSMDLLKTDYRYMSHSQLQKAVNAV